MSVQIDSIHIPLRFLAAHQMQEVQTQGMVTPESASESGRLQLSDYRSAQVQQTPSYQSDAIDERNRRRGFNEHRRRGGGKIFKTSYSSRSR